METNTQIKLQGVPQKIDLCSASIKDSALASAQDSIQANAQAKLHKEVYTK